MNSQYQISSDTCLIELESHFRIRAGPGAGKTFWLANHIKNVVARSKRLSGTSGIACISYTNVAAEEITKRLGPSADRVEVSTIHSFLYRNVVKPYLHLLTNEDGSPLVNYALVDGHDEHRPSYPRIEEWLRELGQAWISPKSRQNLMWHLHRRRWLHDASRGLWRWDLPPTIRHSPPLPPRIADGMVRYKLPYWKNGIIDHDDVLYLSYRILNEHRRLLGFLSARYPYLFIDEFQDTNPVQTQMVKWMAEQGTVVGVIGDSEQAIFGFQGAKREDFQRFTMPGSIDYEIKDNRRSTNRIIAFLNRVRRDGLQQSGLRSVEGEPVCVLVGPVEAITAKARDIIGRDRELAILARKNVTASKFRYEATSTVTADTWEELEQCDRDRSRFFEYLIRGVELARAGATSQAVSEAIKGIRVRDGYLRDPFVLPERVTIIHRQAIGLGLLEHVITHYDELVKLSCLCVYQRLGELLPRQIIGLSLRKAAKGKFKHFAENTRLEILAGAAVLEDEPRLVRTIHKAKAAEFANVLVHLESQIELGRVIDPSNVSDVEEEQEERRITYVALSRARNRLFISIESLNEVQEQLLAGLGLDVVRC